MMRTTPNNTAQKELSLRGRIVCAIIASAFVELLLSKTHFFHGWGDAFGNCILVSLGAAVFPAIEKALKKIRVVLQILPDSADVDPGLQLNNNMEATGTMHPNQIGNI